MEINFKYLSSQLLNDLFIKAESALKRALINADNLDEIKEKEQIYTEIAIQKHRASNPEDFGETPAETQLRKR